MGMILGLIHQQGVLFKQHIHAVLVVIQPLSLTLLPITFSLRMPLLLSSTERSFR